MVIWLFGDLTFIRFAHDFAHVRHSQVNLPLLSLTRKIDF
jgi:hypothetical protein